MPKSESTRTHRRVTLVLFSIVGFLFFAITSGSLVDSIELHSGRMRSSLRFFDYVFLTREYATPLSDTINAPSESITQEEWHFVNVKPLSSHIQHCPLYGGCDQVATKFAVVCKQYQITGQERTKAASSLLSKLSDGVDGSKFRDAFAEWQLELLRTRQQTAQ